MSSDSEYMTEDKDNRSEDWPCSREGSRGSDPDFEPSESATSRDDCSSTSYDLNEGEEEYRDNCSCVEMPSDRTHVSPSQCSGTASVTFSEVVMFPENLDFDTDGSPQLQPNDDDDDEDHTREREATHSKCVYPCTNAGGSIVIEPVTPASGVEDKVEGEEAANYVIINYNDPSVPSTSGEGPADARATGKGAANKGAEQQQQQQQQQQQPQRQGAKRRRRRRVRNTQYCFYCEEPVLQFSRHLVRAHGSEMEVERLEALKKKKDLKARKRLLSVIRNKGNYLSYRATQAIKPVRKAALNRESSNPLPCQHCYGFFARKQLWRHVRRCPAAGATSAGGRAGRQGLTHSQNLSQNLTLQQLQGDDYLRDKVFPRMRADTVTHCVKSDALICAFGSRFAKTHQNNHQINYISRKMRELGKLLLALKKEEPRIKSLMNALTPQYYDLLVKCAKQIAKYDETENRFNSPSFAMNIQASLKECCQVAMNYVNQRGGFTDKASYDEAVFPFKRLVATLTSEWRYDVSHRAGSDLQTASMNKVTIVPLATDLHRFREYLVHLANESCATLRYDEHNVQAYKALVESVYCRVMLLCRKRCGELSRLPLELYIASENRTSYEEFVDAIRPSEMLLVRKFKRVVIQGKRNPTPVIFSNDVQEHIGLLLKVRPNFGVESNPYLFANANTENPIHGYKVITQHAKKAQLKHPEAITSRGLRKHLATVCQVFCMSDEDVEQLSTFMGHTGTTHRRNYRLPDDIFQTAKVSKLLLMMEAGQAGRFKGKTLDEIDVDMEENVYTDTAALADSHEAAIEDEIDGEEPFPRARRMVTPPPGPSSAIHVQDNACSTTTATPPKKKMKKFERVPWTTQEKEIALQFFERHVLEKRPPKRSECETLISEHPDTFKNRSWSKIKVFIHNEYSKPRPRGNNV